MKTTPSYVTTGLLFSGHTARLSRVPQGWRHRMRGAAWVLVALVHQAVWAADRVSGERAWPMPPERVWQAMHLQLNGPAPVSMAAIQMNEARFEARLRPTALPLADSAVDVDVDWDARTGGTRLRWTASSPQAHAQAEAWVERLAESAGQLRASNQLCRGPAPTPEEIEAAQVEIPASCEYSTGHFSTALFELEKCGDFDTALQIMADCVTRRHAGGLIRLSQYFDLGYGVPKRPERVVEFLRLAMDSDNAGYARLARLHYATALHFGLGVAPDRVAARRLFEALAGEGQPDAQEFLRLGHHGAWLRPDGQRHRDAPEVGQAPPVSNDDSGNDMSYGAFVNSDKRIKCLYGYAADKTGDHAAAVRIFEDCIARWNDPYSIIWLAHLLENGAGVPKDPVRAARLLHQGALHPDTSGYATLARYHYGMALALGQGVVADPVQARHWLQRAAQEGLGEAREALVRLDAAPDNRVHVR